MRCLLRWPVAAKKTGVSTVYLQAARAEFRKGIDVLVDDRDRDLGRPVSAATGVVAKRRNDGVPVLPGTRAATALYAVEHGIVDRSERHPFVFARSPMSFRATDSNRETLP
jgi:hypothetical protein